MPSSAIVGMRQDALAHSVHLCTSVIGAFTVSALPSGATTGKPNPARPDKGGFPAKADLRMAGIENAPQHKTKPARLG